MLRSTIFVCVLTSAVALATAHPFEAQTPGEYVCDPLLASSANLLVAFLDPFTGLPYDQLCCECLWESDSGVCQSSGVLPQLPNADIILFAQASPNDDFVEKRFVDDLATGEDPTLLYALELAVHLSATNEFGGLIWGATADVSRYDRLHIRYRTSSPAATFELKLNSGIPPVDPEPTVLLPGSPADGSWREETFVISTDFPGTDSAHLNYLVLATSVGLTGENDPVLFLDHLAFIADPALAASCSVVPVDLCNADPNCFPDLDRYEPHTGAVNIANALSALTFLSEVGFLPTADVEAAIATILTSLAATPRVGGWIQDWHSPASLMPLESNRIGSMTDLPQLYAALMVVEQSWPSLATVAASVRVGMFDLTDLWNPAADGACPGQLFWAMHMCDGVQTGPLNYYGNDALLGEFLAVATGAAPPAFWSKCLPREGCELCGVGPYRFYAPGECSCGNPIPATAVGGPFLQLAPLTYLDAPQLPIGSLSLADSAANMLAAQRDWAADRALALWGWANHSDAETCDYLSCTMFTPEVVTPYISGMGLSLTRNGIDASCAENLFAFEQQGAGAPLDTDTVLHDLGLLDAWNQLTMSGRNDNYLYLDTGWLALGAINACHGGLVRQRFGAHPAATNGYALLASLGIPCPGIFDDNFESGDTTAWASTCSAPPPRW